MKKSLALILCVIMVMSFATMAFARVPSFTMPPEFNVSVAISNLGTITLESKEAIEAAEAAYAALTDDQKAKVTNYQVLIDARATYDALVASQNPGNGGTIDKTGDSTMVFVAMVVLSMTALVILVFKKRAF